MTPKLGVWPCIRNSHLVLGVQGADPGALDGYLDSILPVMEADLFGDIAEAKEADAFAAKYRCSGSTTSVALHCHCLLQQVSVHVYSLMHLSPDTRLCMCSTHLVQKFARSASLLADGQEAFALCMCFCHISSQKLDSSGVLCREAKKCKAYDMYQLLARMVSFRANIGQLLGSVRTHLSDASQPKVYNKLSSLLQHASRGILANPTAQPQDLMVFVHGVLAGGLAQEEAAREAAEAEATAAVRVPGKLAIHDSTTAQLKSWLHDEGCGPMIHSVHGDNFLMPCA